MGCWSSKNSEATSSSGIDESEPKVYSWDNRREKQVVDKEKFKVADKNGQDSAVYRNDVDNLPMTIEDCQNTIVLLFGVAKTIIIDNCDNLLVVAFSSDSTYIRNSTNIEIVLATGQFRCRDCRNLKLFLHCKTQPVIESSTKVSFSPLVIDFPEIEILLKNLDYSRFSNLWSKVHDFGPIGDEPNWDVILEPDRITQLTEIYSKCHNRFLTAPQMSAINGIPYFPVFDPEFSISSQNPNQIAFLIFAGKQAEELASNLYFSLCCREKKARLVQSSAGKLSSISLPDRAKKQLIYDENTLLIGILLLGELSAVDISDFAPPGESYVAFQNDAIADSQMIFNARNLEFE